LFGSCSNNMLCDDLQVQLINPFSLSSWGATGSEVAAPMTGDEHISDPHFSATRSIDVAAPPDRVFPWLRQMGFRRAGWYSYDWVDNFGKESARHILDEWQNVATGDKIPAGPISFVASVVEPDDAFCLLFERPRVQFSLAFELKPSAFGTRLVSRARSRISAPGGAPLARWLLEPGDGLMVRRQLQGIKERAEQV